MGLLRDARLPPDWVWFDRAAPARALRRAQRRYGVASLMVAAILGAMVAAYLESWAALPVAIAAFALPLVGAVALLARVPRATVFCRHCPAAGWIPDLIASAGACPACKGTRFDYRGIRYTGVSKPMPLEHDDTTGAWLLEQKRRRGGWYQ